MANTTMYLGESLSSGWQNKVHYPHYHLRFTAFFRPLNNKFGVLLLNMVGSAEDNVISVSRLKVVD